MSPLRAKPIGEHARVEFDAEPRLLRVPATDRVEEKGVAFRLEPGPQHTVGKRHDEGVECDETLPSARSDAASAKRLVALAPPHKRRGTPGRRPRYSPSARSSTTVSRKRRELKVAQREVVVAQRGRHQTEKAPRILRILAQRLLDLAVAAGRQFADPDLCAGLAGEYIVRLARTGIDIDDQAVTVDLRTKAEHGAGKPPLPPSRRTARAAMAPNARRSASKGSPPGRTSLDRTCGSAMRAAKSCRRRS